MGFVCYYQMLCNVLLMNRFVCYVVCASVGSPYEPSTKEICLIFVTNYFTERLKKIFFLDFEFTAGKETGN